MKINKLFLMGALPLISLVACVNEDLSKDTKLEKGTLDLNVEVQLPEKTRSIATNEFPIIIYNSDGSVFKAFEKLEDVITPLTAPVGTYIVESHTPGEIQKRMSSPYYYGTDTVDVQTGLRTKVLVPCKMKNTSFKCEFSTEFLSTFTSWSVTIDDGSSDVLTFTEIDGATPNTVYWNLDENVSKLNLNFTGATTKEIVHHAVTITKDFEDEEHNDENRNFQGGDAIVINLDPTESTEGDITGLDLRADISFSETGKSVELKVIEGEHAPTDPSNPDEEPIVLTLPEPISFSTEESSNDDPAFLKQGDVKIACGNGIKSIMVRVDSKSDEMMESLQAVADEYEGVNLVNGAEVVGNQNLVDFLAGLGQEISVPSLNDKEYTFPIGNFFLFLGILPGQHNFILEVTDMQENKKQGQVTVTITE